MVAKKRIKPVYSPIRSSIIIHLKRQRLWANTEMKLKKTSTILHRLELLSNVLWTDLYAPVRIKETDDLSMGMKRRSIEFRQRISHTEPETRSQYKNCVWSTQVDEIINARKLKYRNRMRKPYRWFEPPIFRLRANDGADHICAVSNLQHVQPLFTGKWNGCGALTGRLVADEVIGSFFLGTDTAACR